MPRIRMEDDNLFPFPRGAYIGNKKSGAVYINVSNEYVPPDKKVRNPGSRGYTGHKNKCIGKVPDPEAPVHAFFYANDDYRRHFLHLDLSEPPCLADSLSAGFHVCIREASGNVGLTRALADIFGEDNADQMLNLAHCMLSVNGNALRRFSAWAMDNMTFATTGPADTYFPDEMEIGRFLLSTLSAHGIRQFQNRWASPGLSGIGLFCDSATVKHGTADICGLSKGQSGPCPPPFTTGPAICPSDKVSFTDAKRNRAEKAFDTFRCQWKTSVEGKGLEMVYGREFICFLASILCCLLLSRTNSDRNNYTVSATIDTLEAIKAFRNHDTNKYERRYRLTEQQHSILSGWSITDARLDEIIALIRFPVVKHDCMDMG